MKKNKIITAVIFAFALLTTVFAMSNDGNNEPVKQEMKTDTMQVQNEQVQQDEKTIQNESNQESMSSTTAKDWFGFDTGMTEKEFQEHQEAYIKRWIDFQESIVGERKNISEKKIQQIMERTRQDAIIRYQQRLNLNAIPKFKQFGIGPKDYFTGYDAQGVSPYTYATTISQVVVHGKVIATEGGYETKTTPVYTLEVIEMLKGEFYYKEPPKTIKASLWLTNYKVGDEIIAFLGIKDIVKEDIKTPFEDLILKSVGTRLFIREDGYALQGPNSVGKIDQAKKIIKEIDNINNAESFYNMKFGKE